MQNQALIVKCAIKNAGPIHNLNELNMKEIIFDSFSELGAKLTELISSNRKYLYRIMVFIALSIFIYFLSVGLTKISFLDRIDLTDPNNVAELQPLVNLDQRRVALISMLVFFVMLATFIGRWEGFGSILGLILSAFTIYKLMIPLMLIGWNPVIVTMIGGTIVITGTIYFAHGLEWKSTVAIAGALSSIIITLALGEGFRYWLQISGYYGDTVYNLLVNTQRNLDMSGIVISGIVLSGIGLLDDMTITQSSVIKEIVNTNPNLSARKLYTKAMNVGKDHIGAVVNSLFWAYSAASLPLLMLMNFIEVDVNGLISFEFIVEEILRTVVSSSGLILSIPITTFIGVFVYKRLALRKDEKLKS